MNFRSIVLGSFLTLSFASGLVSADPARGNALKAGEFLCSSSGAALLRGRCEYRPLPNGLSSTNQLIEKAKRGIKPINRQKTANNLEPQTGMGGNIEWWFEKEDGSPDEEANQAMGKFLQENDRGPTIQNVPMVKITTTIYEFTKTQERQLGIEMGSYFGNRTVETEPADLEQSLLGGIFKAAFGIGNPTSSFLELGINATMTSSRGSAVIEESTSCEIGASCSASKIQVHHLPTPTDTKAEDVGFKMSTVPQIDPQQPGLIRLERLSISYSKLTGEANAPVVTYLPKSSSDTSIYTDQILVLGSESSEVRDSSWKILGKGSIKSSKKFLIMMKVSLIMPRGVPNPYPTYVTLSDDRSYTQEEIAALPNGKLALSDIFSSIELTCFRDIVNPETSEKICGFRFTQLDQKFMDYRLRFNLKKGGILGMGGNVLFDEEERTQVFKISDLYKGKGYYKLPALITEKASEKFVLQVELDKSNPIAKARRNREAIKGITIPFGYYKGQSQPIEFDQAFIKFVD